MFACQVHSHLYAQVSSKLHRPPGCWSLVWSRDARPSDGRWCQEDLFPGVITEYGSQVLLSGSGWGGWQGHDHVTGVFQALGFVRTPTHAPVPLLKALLSSQILSCGKVGEASTGS